ncbi:MAG TPA: bifunctional phosphoglucose/phosphomannose isomerase [Acidimicrobiia bacterium]|jgi:glucose/mannose-6-phosphate isomerase
MRFLDAVEGLPEQLTHAHQVAGAISPSAFPSAEGIQQIIVCGMGGSGIAGDVLAVSASHELTVPVLVLKQIRTPKYVGPHSLMFALSYSGDTDETVSMARSAGEAGARLVCVSRGGELENVAREFGALHIPCEEGYLPRAALGTLVAPLFVSLFRMGLLPSAHDSLVSAQEQLAIRRDACAPGIDAPKNIAKEAARKLDRTIPLIYGGGALGGVAAYRWKCDVNENAKAPAYSAQYPELDHNEICAWGQHGDVTRQLISIVELRHGFEHEQLGRRFDFTREIIDEAVHQVLSVQGAGSTRLAQLLDLMYLGDWVSCYVALDNDVDPGPIDAIFALKDRLAAT